MPRRALRGRAGGGSPTATDAARGAVPTRPSPRALQNAPKAAIADRRGYVAWDVDHAGWVVELLRPERQTFHGGTLEEALAWCLVWLTADEWGIGAFA